MLKRFLKVSCWFVVFWLLMISAVFVGAMLIQHAHTMESLTQWVRHHQWDLALWRYSSMVFIIWGWSHFIKWIGQRRRWHPEVIMFFARRRYITVFFIIIELLVVNNFLGWVIRHIM